MTKQPTSSGKTMSANTSGSAASGAPASSSSSYGTEFASQTDVAKMKKTNQQSAAKKAQNSGYGQNSQS